MASSDNEHGQGELRWFDPADLRPSPIQHVGLSEDLVQRARAVFNALRPYVSPTFEQFELSFLRDADPESEVRIWENIARAVQRYKERHGPLADADEAVVFNAVLLMSIWVPRPASVPQAQWDELVAIYEGR